jgi:hypothetical protein
MGDEMRQRLSRLAPIGGEPERAQGAEIVAEPRLDQGQHLFDRRVGGELHRAAKGRCHPGRACGCRGRSSTCRLRACRPPSGGRSCAASRGRTTPSAVPCAPRPRPRSRHGGEEAVVGNCWTGMGQSSSASIRRHSPGSVASTSVAPVASAGAATRRGSSPCCPGRRAGCSGRSSRGFQGSGELAHGGEDRRRSSWGDGDVGRLIHHLGHDHDVGFTVRLPAGQRYPHSAGRPASGQGGSPRDLPPGIVEKAA